MNVEWLFAALLVFGAATTPGIAAANDPPLPDAGLDQTVTRGSTVYLDAAGSRDPDGTIERYEWSIAGVDGDATNATTPACPTCERTKFQAEATGTYRATLEVTDDDGATATDALYVTVEPGDPPSVSLSGPTATTTADAAAFTADTDAGAAPLDRLVWKQDGERVATEYLSGGAATTDRDLHFPTDGAHDVTVLAIDEDGQRAADTRAIDVTNPDNPMDDTTDSPASSVPDVDGPRVLTSDDALTGTYELTSGTSGTWIRDGDRVDSGQQTVQTFPAGVHELYATTADAAATFSDGTRTVVADPAPVLETVSVENASIVPVDVHATDDFGNLQSITIEVDGDTVETVTEDGLRTGATGDSLGAVAHLRTLDPGRHEVTVTARDSRGQTDTVTRSVEVPGPPEVVSAGFVQDGPLDQYHPRIDESRYVATYRVVVDLNGVEPELVDSEISVETQGWNSEVNRTATSDGKLVIQKKAYRENIGSIVGNSRISSTRWELDRGVSRASIQVTPSPPEIRISIISPQSADADTISGMALNASGSFDPDGRSLEYDWYGVSSGHAEGPIAKLDSLDVAELVVTDGAGLSSSTRDLLHWFAPELRNASVVDEGPFYPNETVEVVVWSDVFRYSKPEYEDSASFALDSDSGRVVDRELFRDPGPQNGIPEGEPRSRQYRWTVEIPAREFLDSSEPLEVASAPTEKPVIADSLPLEEPTVFVPTDAEIDEIDTSVRYRVERPTYQKRATVDETYRDELLGDGYEVALTTNSGQEYVLEERVKVEDAEYDVDRMEFQQRGRRGMYLEDNPEWEDAGSQLETRSWTTTEREWRSDQSGDGTFTGNTRRKLVEHGRYQTEHEYRHETTETYWTTETYQDTYTTTETETVTRERCTAFGCYNYQTTTTETEYHTVTRTRRVQETRTVTETYWATRPRGWSHERTGRERTITLEEPEYERQYEFEVEERHEETTRVYFAAHRTLVQPAEYEWQTEKTVARQSLAELEANADDTRIAETRPTREWILKKQDGTEVTTRGYTEPDWEVLETIGTAEATVIQHYTPNSGKQVASKRTKEQQTKIEIIEQSQVTREKIKDQLVKELKRKHER
ncbi:PKD domain-containing protein [Halobacterium yunchengense]|uniref:PKD domain-containing protein n=1 Tax=Halobacterium yunchengense TaxID=3108497 RepID=UPI00300A8EAD